MSPNPGGRPAVLREVRDLARQHTARAIERLAAMLDDEDGRVVVAAASVLLDRGWGKPEQAVVADVTVARAVDVDALRASLVARAVALALPPADADHLLSKQAAEETPNNGGTCEAAVRDAVRSEPGEGPGTPSEGGRP
jgi:hypothetical protein